MTTYMEFFSVFFRDLYLFFLLLYVAECLTGTTFVFTWMRVYAQIGSLLVIARYVYGRLFKHAATAAAASAPLLGPRLTKTTRRGTSRGGRLEFVVSEMQGWRDAMEDASVTSEISDISVFAVFDGHGGSAASRICAESLTKDLRQMLQEVCAEISAECIATALTRTYARLDERLLAASGTSASGMDLTGTTAVVAISWGDALVVANAGDSRAVLCRGGKAVELSHDHKPDSPRERQRIEKAGGRVTAMGPCYRVDWGLNLSRALGDFKYKQNLELGKHEQKISAIPDIVLHTLQAEDEFLLLACDGVFELLSNQEVVDFVCSSLNKGVTLERTAELLLDECCAKDPALTMGRGTDNETCIIVKFNNH